jgi:pyruvate dehydrogenase E2 component (dihydrolipoamide acetyltransferase)
MATEVKLPDLGEGVTEGELIKYLVQVGDSVKPDQPIAELMTDKATVEVPSPVAGKVKELKFKAGDMIKIESVLLTLESGSSSAEKPAVAAANPSPQANSKTPPAGASRSATSTINSTVNGGSVHSALGAQVMSQSYYPPVADSKVLATPATRRLAREMNIDINQLSGSGLAGRVTREDVLTKSAPVTSGSLERVFPTPAQRSGPALARLSADLEERVPLRGVRKKIAENMQLAKHIIPHFTLMDEADVTELVSLRDSLKDFAEKNQTKLTYLPFVMKALIATCKQFPMVNASIDDAASEVVYKKYFNLGFAADTPTGLMVPVIKDADQKTILEISKEILDLAKRARDGKLKLEEMKNATVTITNIGSVGGTYATPIINHPEVAILGMYKIQDKLSLGADGKVFSRKFMNFTITADHRLIDGAVAANFLKAFINKIEKPGMLMMEMI